MAALATAEFVIDVDCCDSEKAAAARWVQHAVGRIHKNSSSGGEVDHTELIDWMQSASPPPPSLRAMWEKCVWRLQDEPDALYRLRCLAGSFGHGGNIAASVVNSSFSFLLDARVDLPPFPTSLDSGKTGECGLQRHTVRVVALRLIPSTTDVIQLGWCAAMGESLRPLYGSRSHVVIQLLVSGKHCSAWAYGDVGAQLCIGTVLCAVMYGTETEDGRMAYVIHSVAELDAAFASASAAVVVHGTNSTARGDWARAAGTPITSSLLPHPTRPSFAKLLEMFAPEIAGQMLCKSLLFLVAAHTLYRAVRCRFRRPLHMLLLGASRSGKSALLRWFLRLLGPHATLVGLHVVYGQQRSVGLSQAITATYPHVRRQLLFGGAVSTFDALVIDELSSRGCTGYIEGLMTGMCPIGGGGGGGGGGGTATPSVRGHTTRIRAQVTAAANDDLLAAAALMPQFALVARTTAQLSIHSTASVGEGVIAASVARSQSSSFALSRSASLCEPSPRRPDAVQSTGPLSHEFLLAAVTEAPPPSALEGAIPPGVFVRFYLRCLGEYFDSGGGGGTSSPLGLQLAVLWELNLARLIVENGGGSSTINWSETLAEEVWQSYKHHLWAVGTAATRGSGANDDHDATRTLRSDAAHTAAMVRTKRNRPGRKAACVLLLRMMARVQKASGGAAVPEERARAMYEQMGGEERNAQSFSTVIQQLMDAALIIRRLNAYAVVGEM